MSEMASAYVQIIPSAKGINGSIKNILSPEAESAGRESGQSLGNSLVSSIKTVIAAAGIGTIIKEALSAGGDIQQSFGGLDTLYEDAGSAMKDFAAEAASYGVSMNDYAEQAVSFGASLKAAYGGDTLAAAQAADLAIKDMADNSAKMGTDITSIQTAYQGFAKQNYTMLDNLKLGYGGTKAEMERLLEDAEKLSGVKYDINNLGDVYSAIHVIQEDLNLTGVAADEAATTFTGSMGAMKASATNFLAELTTGGDVETSLSNLISSATNFFQNNLLPMIGNLLTALPDVVSTLLSSLIGVLNQAQLNAGDLVDFAVNFITSLVETFVGQAPYLIESIIMLASTLFEALINYDWIGTMTEMASTIADDLSLASSEIFGNDDGILTNLSNAILEHLPGLVDTALNIVTSLGTFILENIDVIIATGAELLMNFIFGLMEELPSMIESATEILNGFLNTILDHLPEILEMGVQLLLKLIEGIITHLPDIVIAIGQLIITLLLTIAQHLPEILQKGIELIGELVTGIVQAIPKVVEAIGQVITGIKDAFMAKWEDFKEAGKNIIAGIVEGITGAAEQVWNAVEDVAKGALDGAKKFLRIESPSKVMREQVGKNISLGLAEGIDRYGMTAVNAAVNVGKNVLSAISDPLQANITASKTATINLNVVGEVNGKAFLELVNNGLGVQL